MLEGIGFVALIFLRIILFLIAFLLFAVLAILFIPLRYDSEGEFYDEMSFCFRLSWFLKSVRFSIRKQGEKKEQTVKVFFFQIYPKKDKKKRMHITSAKEETKEETEPKRELELPVETEEKKEEKTIRKPKVEEKAKKTTKTKVKKEKEATDKKEESKFQNVLEKMKKFYSFLEETENAKVLSFLISYIKKLIKAILPRKAKGRMIIGLEDPALTGYMAACTSWVYLYSKGKVHIIPDFQQKIMNGTYKIKGKVYLYKLIYYIIRVILDHRVKRLISLAKDS
ncbi:MAG: DUF2953 domain-containing protein [Vallitaleaceae bacterium]|nr:DUF2953 domain-containing protein [Vallitaleaceae bacterium]